MASNNLKWSDNTQRCFGYDGSTNTINYVLPISIIGKIRIYYEYNFTEGDITDGGWFSAQLNGVNIPGSYISYVGIDGWQSFTADVDMYTVAGDILTVYGTGQPYAQQCLQNARISYDITDCNASFTSNPPGARIWIDNIDKGLDTPGTVTGLSAGSHTYKLAKAGYVDATGNFSTAIGQNTIVPLVTFGGSASFTSSPTGARIWIDSVDRGVNTPNTISGLSPGSHSYTLKLTGYVDTTGSFSVTTGSTTIVPTVTLTQSTGSVSFTSTPSGARIFINDIDQIVYTPNTISGLSAGSYTYKLTLVGYTDATGPFSITVGQTTNVSTILSGTAMAFLAAGD